MLRHLNHRDRSLADTILLPFRYLVARVRVALVYRAALAARRARGA